ncbi:hypothetical protein GCM10027577_01750 [Spirosoma fluminis]
MTYNSILYISISLSILYILSDPACIRYRYDNIDLGLLWFIKLATGIVGLIAAICLPLHYMSIYALITWFINL